MERTPPDRKYAWSQLKEPVEFSLDSTAGDKLPLKLKAGVERDTRTITLEAQLAGFNGANPQPVAEGALNDLKRLGIGIEFRQPGQQETGCRREFIRSEGKLIVKFENVPGGIEGCNVQITSWKSRKAGAMELEQPLAIKKTDQEL